MSNRLFQIYTTLTHQNILGFIAADNKGNFISIPLSKYRGFDISFKNNFQYFYFNCLFILKSVYFKIMDNGQNCGL